MASGAVMLNFLRSRGDDIASYNPIDYTPQLNESWVKYKFKKPFILVDFRYHPAADWWFDHHQTSFTWPALKSWKKKYKNDNQHFRDSKFKSCASLVSARLANQYAHKAPKHISELVRWTDIIDGGQYKSIKDVFKYDKPALKLRSFIANEKNQNNRKKLIGLLASEPVVKVVKESIISKKIHKYITGLKTTLQNLNQLAVVKNNAAFVDSTASKFGISHFMLYYIFPKIKYSLTLEKSDGSFSLGVGKNKWAKPVGRAKIGKLMAQYGGGGHDYVGATQQKLKSELLKIAQEVIEYLNKHG